MVLSISMLTLLLLSCATLGRGATVPVRDSSVLKETNVHDSRRPSQLSHQNKRYHRPEASIVVSSLHTPDAAANRMLLVDLSALRQHHLQEPPPDDYYSRSSASASSSGDVGDDHWDDSMMVDDMPSSPRWYRSHEEYLNEIGDSDRLLMPFLPENTVGLHYGSFPFVEDVLQLQRQSSREDAFSDYLRDHMPGSRHVGKRGVFVSQSWLPGGHPEPSTKHQTAPLRRPGGRTAAKHGNKTPGRREQPTVPLLFSSKWWHPGGRKRNIFFSRGWGPGGRPLSQRDGEAKKPALPPNVEDVATSEDIAQGSLPSQEQVGKQFPRTEAGGAASAAAQVAPAMSPGGSASGSSSRRQYRTCQQNCWGIPHLFGPYW